MIPHQLSETPRVLPYYPIGLLPDNGTVHFAKQGRRVIGRLKTVMTFRG